MPGKYSKRKKSPVIPILVAIIVLLAASAAGLFFFRNEINAYLFPTEPTVPTETTVPPTSVPETTVPPTTVPEVTEPIITSTASISVTGDLLMHKPVFQSCWDAEANDWVFDGIFAYVKEYVESFDYAVANLETTLCGPDNGYAYSGNPLFNCPDGIAVSSLNAGFDMLLSVNNHCYDTRIVGVQRTLEVLEEVGIESLGTQASAEDVDYKVIEVNGIKIGMTAYTAQTVDGDYNLTSINAIACHPNADPLINSFDYYQLDKFYEEIGAQFDAMKAEGAEAIVVYMHWGEEYQLSPNDYQTKIAQKLCDMGVDVIVGGHPHVIQPVDLLTGTEDENQKTLCIYSTGNAVSNQRIHEMRLKTGHTEDGILFNFTFVKYSDGTVMVQSTDAIPTWVHMVGNKESYTILPLDDETRDQWQEKYGIDDTTFTACENSYMRTMDLVGEGLEKAQEYYDTVNAEKIYQLEHPELFPEPTEAPTEPATEPAGTDPTGTEPTGTESATEPAGTEGTAVSTETEESAEATETESTTAPTGTAEAE